MRQGIQNNINHKELKSHGCYFLTLCKFADNLRIGEGIKSFSDEEIINFYEHCKKEGWIKTGLWNGSQVTAMILEKVKIMNYLQGVKIFKVSTHEVMQPKADFYPIKFVQGNLTHFVLGSGGKIIWDSWSPSAEMRMMSLAKDDPYRCFNPRTRVRCDMRNGFTCAN